MKKYIYTFILCLWALPVLAHGPYYIYPPDKGGEPYRWKDGKIKIMYDSGPLSENVPLKPANDKDCKTVSDPCSSSVYTCGILECLKKQYEKWEGAKLKLGSEDNFEDFKAADIDIIDGGSVGEDITADNYQKYFDKAEKEHIGIIIFDPDGSVMAAKNCQDDDSQEAKACQSNAKESFLGVTFLSLDDNKPYYTGSVIIFNGYFLDGKDEAGKNDEYSPKEYSGTVLHELGHLIGLDHSQPLREALGAAYNDAASKPEGVPTMYPNMITSDQADLHFDDVIGLYFLYAKDAPNKDFEKKFCVIKGAIKNVNNGNPYQGVNAIAYANSDDDKYVDARSYVSGVLSVPGAVSGDYGNYVLAGIVPGREYRVIYEAILNEFQQQQDGGCQSSINPYCVPGYPYTGPTSADFADASNTITYGDDGSDVVVCKKPAEDGEGQVLAMNDSDAKPADTVDESQASVPAEEKKGWCMIASGGVAPVWGALFVILVAGLAVMRRKIRARG